MIKRIYAIQKGVLMRDDSPHRRGGSKFDPPPGNSFSSGLSLVHQETTRLGVVSELALTTNKSVVFRNQKELHTVHSQGVDYWFKISLRWLLWTTTQDENVVEIMF